MFAWTSQKLEHDASVPWEQLHPNFTYGSKCIFILPSALTHNPHTHIPQPEPPRLMVKLLAPRTS